ncbi:protein tweety homolog 1-B-like isoform X3 [Haliotis cracherodii]|uniref:protein tweety homolog 1-B-like isoform X3 n=1 Tax=Haliotis cracherodii TaxID=6455 RepID=UPI0039ECE393
MSTAQYHQTWLVDFFHSFPHIDLTFQYTNSTFDPERPTYREALIFFAALPVLWCIISLLLFSCYYVVQCCKDKPKKRRKTGCLKVFIGLMVTLGCVALAFGFYGNEEANDGVDDLADSLADTNQTLQNAKHTLTVLDDLAGQISRRGVQALQNVTDSIGNGTVRVSIHLLIKTIIDKSAEFRTDIKVLQNDTGGFNLQSIKEEIDIIEFYRWLATLILNTVFVFLNLLFLIGIVKSSKCVLVTAAVGSLCCLILMWGASGFYIGVSMATGDLCSDPDLFVRRTVSGTVKKDVLEAYLTCTDNTKPFTESIVKANEAVAQATSALNKTVALAKPYNISDKIRQPVAFLRRELKYVVSNLTALNDVVNCEHIHNNYVKSVKGICDKTMIGLAFMCLMSLIVGLTITFAIAFASRTWPHFGKRRGYYPVDDTDPFLPRPPPYESYGTMRSYEREGGNSIPSLGRRSLASEQGSRPFWIEDTTAKSVNEESGATLNLPMGESPPPAYHPGRYSSMQQYNNLAPHPGAMQGSSEA